MIGRLLFYCGRLTAAAIFLITWGYGVTTYSPFAFDMFVRPRLLPELVTFVNWHHVFYWIAFCASALTLIPDLRSPRRGAAWWAAVGYILVFGGVGVHVLGAPYLATLTAQSRSLWVVPGALLPLVWLAAIDHLAGGVPSPPNRRERTTGQRPLLAACLASAVFLWAAHLVAAGVAGRTVGSGLAQVSTGVWALAIDLSAFLVVYAVLSLVAAVAATRTRAFAWEFCLTVALAALGVTELWRRIVLPSFAFTAADAAVISITFGATIALMWSGLAVRRPVRDEATAIGHLTSALGANPIAAAVVLLITALIAATVITRIEPLDWAYILHSFVAIVEATIVFGVFMAQWSRANTGTWSSALAVAPPLAAVAVLYALPHAATAWANNSGNAQFAPSVAIDRLAPADALASLAANRLLAQPSFDIGYYRDVLATESRQSTLDPAVPADTLVSVAPPPNVPHPHVFMFVIDGLRRDYLSPYNRTVTFTPAIDALAADSFVFRNAFTAYAGTWLSMPAIWTGSAVTRGWGRVFPRLNALEALIGSGGFDFVINEFTVATLLRPTLDRTFLDPDIPSVQTDLCRNLQSLQDRLANRSTAAPMFAYLAPMNVHILNTGIASTEKAGQYPGFYAPYASRLERIDGCLGAFVQYLKARNLYDNSIIILTSDHGEILGEEGRWGHQFYLFPEVLRIPLIVHVPASVRSTVTTDLARVTFLSDLQPTLAALLGRPTKDLGPLFGSPLFVSPANEPQSRRRTDFLVMSSYGPTFGVLRRNARFLYVSDLRNFREYAYTLFEEPNGRSAPPDSSNRSVHQRLIRQHLDHLDALYRRR
jgi:hypothetical protein